MSRRLSTTMEYFIMNDQKDITNDVRLKVAKVRARSRSICMPPPLTNSTLSSSSGAGSEFKRPSQIPRSSITAMTTSAKAKVRSPYTNDRPTKYNKSTSPPPTNTLEPNNTNRHHRRSTTANNNKSVTAITTTGPWNDDDALIKFFDSDSDEDELFLRNTDNKVKSSPLNRRRQGHTIPAPTPAPVDNADQNHDQSLWAELQELKSRLAKLEGTQTSSSNNNNNNSSSSSKPTISRRSSQSSSLFLSPHSSLVDSACSIVVDDHKNQEPSRSQKALQDTVTHLEQQQRQYDDRSVNTKDTTTPFMDTLISLVTETITINQILTSLTSRQQVSSGDLLTIQKSSDHQIKLLTETLQSLGTTHYKPQQQQQQQQQQQKQQQQKQQQHQTMDPPMSPPLSPSGSINNDLDAIKSPKPAKHRVLFSSPIGAPPSPQKKSSIVIDQLPPSSPQKQQQKQYQHQHQCSLLSSPSSSSSSSRFTGQKRQSTNIISFKDHDHKVTPSTKSTKSVNGILYYPQNGASLEHQTSPQAFYPMSSSRVNQLLSKYESLLSFKPTTRKKSAAAPQHHVDIDRFSSFIDC